MRATREASDLGVEESARGTGALNSVGDQELETLLFVEAGQILRVGRHSRTRVGRETFRWTLADGTRAIVKRFRGASRREVWRARLRGSRPASPGRAEHDTLVALAELGLPVPRALGWTEAGDLSLVVMEEIEHGGTLRELLNGGARALGPSVEPLFENAFAIVDRLHGAGWYHRDLYLDHFLVGADGRELFLIDVGRARREDAPRLRWFVKDLAALLHSVPPALCGASCLRFLSRWLDRRGFAQRSARRRIARAVIAKERRMAAHEPRGGTSFPAPNDAFQSENSQR